MSTEEDITQRRATDSGLGGGRYGGENQDTPAAFTVRNIPSRADAERYLRESIGLAQENTRKIGGDGGTTATIAVVLPDGQPVVAHLGDSPAYIIAQNPATGAFGIREVTNDHSPTVLKSEIERRGGLIINDQNGGSRLAAFDPNGKVVSGLAVGAGVGDFDARGLKRDPDIITPDLRGLDTRKGAVFVVSDGISDELKPQQILDIYLEGMNRGLTPTQTSELIIERAKSAAAARGKAHSDNMAVSVSTLKPKQHAEVVSVFDGHGRDGSRMSQLSRNAALDLAATKYGGYGPVRRSNDLSFSDGAAQLGETEAPRSIGDLDWKLIEKGGLKGIQVNVEGFSAADRQGLVDALRSQGIDASILTSSVEGGQTVVRVMDPAGVEQIRNLMGQVRMPDAANRIVADPPRESGPLGTFGKRAGIFGGLVVGLVAGAATLWGGGSAAEAAEATVEIAVPYGEPAIYLARGDFENAAQSATVETVSNGASVAGSIGGAVLGQIMIPIPVVGAATGLFVVGALSGLLAGTATDLVIENGQRIAETTMTYVNGVSSVISEAYAYATNTSLRGMAGDMYDVASYALGDVDSLFVSEAQSSNGEYVDKSPSPDVVDLSVALAGLTEADFAAYNKVYGDGQLHRQPFVLGEGGELRTLDQLGEPQDTPRGPPEFAFDPEALRKSLLVANSAGLSPETQSLAAVAGNAELFAGQLEALLAQGSFEHVLADMAKHKFFDLMLQPSDYAQMRQSPDLVHRVEFSSPPITMKT